MRDLEKDLAIIEAATPGPIRITPCQCGYSTCRQVFISITHSDGRLDPEDAQFIVEARAGWPETIRALQKADAEIDRLRNELNIVYEALNQRSCGR